MTRDSVSRRAVLVGAIAAIVGAGTGDGARAGEQETEPVRVRVLSYNIRHGEGVDGALDLPRIARVIQSVDPDIVALQEVDRGVRRSEGVDQPAELARLTGMTALFERNIEHQGGDYGNALLTRLPVQGHRNVHLESFTEGEQRGVLVVDLTAPDGATPLRVLATHLDYRPGDTERLASAARINALAVEDVGEDRPAILMGDLNAQRGSRTLAAFETTWTHTSDEPLPTIPVDVPTRQIDFILVRPEARWKVVETRVLDEPIASDHRPIFAVLELVEDEAPR